MSLIRAYCLNRTLGGGAAGEMDLFGKMFLPSFLFHIMILGMIQCYCVVNEICTVRISALIETM